jgi:signal transduction histidine kinase
MSSSRLILKAKTFCLSLQGKFILIFSLLTVFLIAALGFFFVHREEHLLIQQVKEKGELLAESMAISFTNALLYEELGLVEEAGLLDNFIADLMREDELDVVYALVLDTRGKVIAHNDFTEYGHVYTDPMSKQAMASWKTIAVLPAGDRTRRNLLHIATPLNISTKRWGTLRLGLSLEKLQQALAALTRQIVFWTIGLILLSIGGLTLVTRRMTRPLITLATAIDQVDLEHYTLSPLPPPRRDEIGSLQVSFLSMLQRLKEAEEERQKTLELLVRTEKMVSLGKLAAGVAHEINNPLAGLLTCLHNLSADHLPPQRREEYIRLMEDGLRRISTIIRHLLDYARQYPPTFQQIDLLQIIEQNLALLDYLLTRRAVKVQRFYSLPHLFIEADRSKLEQAIMNITLNAIQAMEPGGVLTFRVHEEEATCQLSIADTGPGIPAEILPRVFDPFFTTKEAGEGTGLGLAVSLSLVNQHGGTITVQSAVGEGTTFTITLPLRQQPLGGEAVMAPAGKGA